MSPYQIFVRGCLTQQLQHHTGIQGVYGADEQPVPVADQGAVAPAFNELRRVVVPLNQFQPSN